MKKLIFLGLLLGLWLTGCAQNNMNQVRDQSVKYQRLLALIDAFYVDTVNLEKITEDAIMKALSDLDPHSVYISKEELDEMNEPLEGSFFGIGIQFSILRDSLIVVSVVSGGPSEKVGLMEGDRIISVDGENITGLKLSNADVRNKLKGERGSIVRIGVRRGNQNLDFNIKRDKVAINSIDASYMMDDKIGYIKMARFAVTTIDEFDEAVIKLKQQGMTDLVLDLQTNTGGYMGTAIGICDDFLPNNRLIVYTEGLSSGRRDEYTTSRGLFQEGRVVILIDQNSASASEIVSGAIQDWDRGVIVGRRSFGKGLVQRQFPLTDGSAIHLTTAFYYTPSGRSIQKPYQEEENYRTEVLERYGSGELFSADSIMVNDSLKFYTKIKHRLVYGGGGIVPDVFVPIDTAINYMYFNRLIAKNVIGEYISNYVDRNRTSIRQSYPDFNSYMNGYNVSDAMIEDIVVAGEAAGIERDNALLQPILPTMKLQIKALIARDVWDVNEMYKIMNSDNDVVRRGYKVLKDGTYERILQ
ncbi:MAG: S41 family peptidase [Odoribacter sp.]|nr:S41 family peptidase [Odoribacter sp.]